MYQPTQAERNANLATAVEGVVFSNGKVKAQIVRGTLEGFHEAGHEVFARDVNRKNLDLFLQFDDGGEQKQYFRLSGDEFNIEKYTGDELSVSAYDLFRTILETEGAPMDRLYNAEHGRGGVEIEPTRSNMIRFMYQTITGVPALTRG